jgi:hypothetical protein
MVMQMTATGTPTVRCVAESPPSHPRHGRPTGQADGPPEDRLRPAIHVFLAGPSERRGWRAFAHHDVGSVP